MLALTITTLLAAISAFAVPGAEGRNCGSNPTASQVAKAEAQYVDDLAADGLSPQSFRSFTTAATKNIQVYWHVIRSGNSLSQGNIPDDQIVNQINVLNKAYASCGISFTLAGTDRTTNADWFNSAGPDSTFQTAMKKTLRKGGAGDLNFYSVGFTRGTGEGLLGYATFPVDYARRPTDDGVVLLYSSLPGGSTTRFDLGFTAVHEAGHWCGLYHTFQDGCSGPGDFVSDTPAEESPARGCPTNRDTCTGGGPDPVHNYMDYSDDSCLSEFTFGQCSRMAGQLSNFRGLGVPQTAQKVTAQKVEL
ncbi:hypothetical protein FS837_007886 [Tulasnella sp. UAMH 9824]|nr:hypothetical protein FS837_007886 [Tulasnella sp. UAMH 9824]